jgi:sarcosine oxidase subunit gamma
VQPFVIQFSSIKKTSEETVKRSTSMIIMASPLEGKSLGNISSVMLREIPDVISYDFRTVPGSRTFKQATEIIELHLPAKVGATATSSKTGHNIHALTLGPDQWLIVGMKDIEERLNVLKSNPENHYGLVNVSEQRTTIELTGKNARCVLEHVWEQDLREKSFPAGSSSQGLIARSPVILWHVEDFNYRVMVRSSFAVHVWSILTDAASELI